MTKSTKALITLALLSACGGVQDPLRCVDHCDGTTVVICIDGVEVAAFACPGPGGCAVSGEAVACDSFYPQIGDECSFEQFESRLRWCVESLSDVIARCHYDPAWATHRKPVPQWVIDSVCPSGYACAVSDGSPSCVADG